MNLYDFDSISFEVQVGLITPLVVFIHLKVGLTDASNLADNWNMFLMIPWPDAVDGTPAIVSVVTVSLMTSYRQVRIRFGSLFATENCYPIRYLNDAQRKPS